MNAPMLAVTILGSMLGGGRLPSWLSDYHQAQATGAIQQKPLAIFFAAGANNAAKVAVEGKLDAQAMDLLAGKYLPVFIDTSSVDGAKLARGFEIRNGVGLVISDRTGSMQAFWHEGQLSNQNLARYLGKYADARTVARTETASQSRTSFYPAEAPGNSGTDSNYCPT